MRIDEQGRWVSDDGYYVWHEDTQAWLPAAPAVAHDAPTGGSALPSAAGDPAATAVAGGRGGWGGTDATGPVDGGAGRDPGATTVQPQDSRPGQVGSWPPQQDAVAAQRTTVQPTGGYGEPAATARYGGGTSAFGQPAGYRGPDQPTGNDSWGPQPGPAGASPDDDDGGPGRPAWLLPAAIAALVVIVAGGLFLLLHKKNSNDGSVAATQAPATTPATVPTTAVTTVPKPATVPTVPATTAAPRPTRTATVPAGGASQSAVPASRQYSQLIQTAYTSACTGRGGSASYCGCTLTELELRYTQSQFLQLNEQPNSTRTKQVISRIARQCISRY